MNRMLAPAVEAGGVECEVNGRRVALFAPRFTRLSDALRLELGLTGTKVGCSAGDCGACTVLLDGAQVCSCMVAVGQAEGRRITTVEGLASDPRYEGLRAAFHRLGAAQCGICTPGMLMAAADLLDRDPSPSGTAVKDALGGVLCRCTGYQAIVAAVLEASRRPGTTLVAAPGVGAAVGARLPRLDGAAKLDGSERYGADAIPADALWLRVFRSPHAHARFAIGDLKPLFRAHPGLVQALRAADVPHNGFGIYPTTKDQPVLADGVARFQGEAVLALIGTREAIEALYEEEMPLRYEPLPALLTLDEALAPGAPEVQAGKAGNVLIEGRLRRGDAARAIEAAPFRSGGRFETAYVEHAYIEPEAGWARRIGDRVEIHVSTQTPYMDRDETALIMGLAPEQVRIVPSACGGGFGGKLDLSVQPLVALGAWLTGRPVACVYSRPESMVSTTKRHAARIEARFACERDGRLSGVEFDADFNTGPYASWGPTVAGRVPVHATGPYRVPNVATRGRAILTNGPNGGAFRGFGVPQAAIVHETLMDDLALAAGIDRLEFRRLNALRAGDTTATGQRLEAGVGLIACLDALQPHWRKALDHAKRRNGNAGPLRRGVGIACMWYGIGNTGMANPSVMQLELTRDGTLLFRNGAVDIGQGSTTALAQIAADALGLPVEALRSVVGDTDLTADAGKTSASRQTFVSGNAARLAGEAMRMKMLRLANASAEARLALHGATLVIADGAAKHRIELTTLPERCGVVLSAEGRFDPPVVPLDDDGQGVPYATYAFAAQLAVVDVDIELGTTRVRRIVAAHDVGRAINPTLIEGQIAGGIAQGLGLALMEEYLPGQTDNLHDYLIPTFGDMPEIEFVLIEDQEPLGPFGAKGVGEPGLVPTAPAILSAIRHATGVRMTRTPVLPHRLRAALKAQGVAS